MYFRYKAYLWPNFLTRSHGLVDSILTCHPGGPGSIPGHSICFSFSCMQTKCFKSIKLLYQTMKYNVKSEKLLLYQTDKYNIIFHRFGESVKYRTIFHRQITKIQVPNQLSKVARNKYKTITIRKFEVPLQHFIFNHRHFYQTIPRQL